MKINILDSSIFNKIAAGEVVDKPASLVKELVENSIDAGASNIQIEIENGGIDLIKVVDDGCGIDFEDLPKAFLPHATSKIKTVEDLSKIGTLGFRGEALASISAVSDVEVISRTANGEGGRIEVVDTVINPPIETGAGLGTTIIITNLFKNIPARKKFLRKPKQEEGDITNYIEKLIMANPQISFRYVINGKQIYLSTGKNLKEAIYVVYGKQVLDNLIEIKKVRDNYKIEGFISKPTYSRANRNYQTLIVNGRYLQNQTVGVAVQNAYGAYMMKGQFPFYVLNITLPVEDIDVNVHPNKLDCRFVDKNKIFSLVYNSIVDALVNAQTKVNVNEFVEETKKEVLDNNFLKNMTTESLEELLFGKGKGKLNTEKPIEDDKKIYELFDKKDNKNENEIQEEPKKYINRSFDNSINIGEIPPKKPLKTDKDLEEKYIQMMKGASLVNEATEVLNINSSTINSMQPNTIFDEDFRPQEFVSYKNRFNDNTNDIKIEVETTKNEKVGERFIEPELKIIGTCFSTYILVEKGDLFIIDQHAGHERILYDELTKLIDEKRLLVQELLIPYDFEVASNEVEFVESNTQNLKELGFDVSQIGEKRFSISSVPVLLDGINLKEFVDIILSSTDGILKLKNSDLIKDKLKQMSCKKAIKAGYVLKKNEIEYLLKLTEERETALLCPHGRPSVIRVSKQDLEKWFRRAL